MLQLKSTIIELLRCEVGDGCSASFWFDSWTAFGQLITFIGASGPRLLRIRKDAKVSEAMRDGNWALPAARSDNSQALLVALTDHPPPVQSRGRDTFLWRNASGNFLPSFSSKETWEQLRVHNPLVPWSEVIWFKEHVPRYSFIAWLAMLNRLPTRDRLRRWGMNIPATCVLCSNGEEDHNHLFFECSFSSGLWTFFAEKFPPNPPATLAAASSWILHHSQPHLRRIKTILKLLFQSVVYHLWKERNARIFSATETPIAALRLTIDSLLRSRLLSLQGPILHSPSLLLVYFSNIYYPL
ncbi:PREDICTED: uncharacterized protein LOC109126452 [Camelina sativa]|uniref:Uncharacterized protein LOC109126452 n=1 Tax=Camelina sativa TaxID=90675 RepID=A0ABM1QFL3_CAMSA|nr:PREDICTED: uncharacterized protein LOC109126452 [Camelina sativa]